MTCLHKITTIKDTIWDSAAARNVVDLLGTVDKVVHLFERLGTVPSPQGSDGTEEDEVVSYGMKKLHRLKTILAEGTDSRKR